MHICLVKSQINTQILVLWARRALKILMDGLVEPKNTSKLDVLPPCSTNLVLNPTYMYVGASKWLSLKNTGYLSKNNQQPLN